MKIEKDAKYTEELIFPTLECKYCYKQLSKDDRIIGFSADGKVIMKCKFCMKNTKLS